MLVILPINTFAWYTELDNPGIRIDRSKVTTYAGDFHIPYKKNPNLDTLKFYMMKYNIDSNKSMPTKL